jgi:hypothetical protein
MDLPDGGFGFEYCCNRSFSVDNVRIERSLNPATKVDKEGDDTTATVEQIREMIKTRRNKLNEDLAKLSASRPAEPGRLAVVGDYSPELPAVPLLIRGEHNNPGELVPAGAPHVLAEPNNPIELDRLNKVNRERSTSTGRRLAFADWLTRSESRASGLLARVTVNRWWSYHFGRGVVDTPENDSPRVTRLSGSTARRKRLETEVAPPADPEIGRLSTAGLFYGKDAHRKDAHRKSAT